MKKLLTVLAIPLLSLCSVGSVAAQAATGCTINGTGPNSVNTCTLNQDNSLTVNCNNGATVTFTNTQVANSGTATVNGNTTGGGANSGNAGNVNQFITDIQTACGYVAPTLSPSTPQTPTQVAAAPAPSPAAAKSAPSAAPAVLPATGVDQTVRNAMVVVASVLSAAVAAIGGLSLYRRATN